MRIERPNNIQPVNPYQQQGNKQENVKKGTQRDQLEISSEALDLQKNQETEAQRANRIAQLKEQVQAGTYHVDPYKVAEKLLERGL
ncbi:flagellar biosynthesis anti-sigma factor FlgM [Aneurinibacillus terranovensis]|uniref:flagellar biosynthesis anti-sigma factor FlgM n=1 Tax=Aneurinibacillus terranovensis TaxID=278991 RepID=UPI000426EAF5|nr:flagellar biosynthesis anti-sigma factor FlgM [Aneurinibacillus terranovensis]